MIEIKKGIFTHCLASHDIGEGIGDVLYGIQTIKGQLTVIFRTRKYIDKFAHNSLDTKEWSQFKTNCSIEEVIEKLSKIANELEKELDIFWINSEEMSPEQTEEMDKKDWMHTREGVA